ncbi:MAG: hypothetical protein ACK5VA_18505 [Pseudanabaena sp.]
MIWECYAQHLTTQGQAIGEGEEVSAFANGGLCGVLGNGGANAKPLQIFPFTFLLLPWSNATSLSVLITGVGVINEIVVEPRTTFCHEVIKI